MRVEIILHLSISSSSYAITSGFESNFTGSTDCVCAFANTYTKFVSGSVYGPSNQETYAKVVVAKKVCSNRVTTRPIEGEFAT